MTTITLYTAPDCHYCALARQFFTTRGLPFTEHDVSADPLRWSEMIESSHQLGVPVIAIGAEVIVGFDKNRVEKALGGRGGRAPKETVRRAKRR